MVDVKPWASQVRKNCHMAIPETASQRIGGANLLVDFANSSLYITARMQKLYEEKHAIRFPLWREGDHPPRRMVESRILYVRA